MLNIERARRIITGQGADGLNLLNAIVSLQAGGYLPTDNQVRLSPREAAALLIGATAPDPTRAADYLVEFSALADGNGATFGEVLKSALEADPAKLQVVSLRVSHSPAAAWITGIDGEEQEFAAEFQDCSFRRETIIGGGLIGALSMGLHSDTESGWTDKELDAEGE